MAARCFDFPGGFSWIQVRLNCRQVLSELDWAFSQQIWQLVADSVAREPWAHHGTAVGTPRHVHVGPIPMWNWIIAQSGSKEIPDR